MEPKHLGEALPRLVDRLVENYLTDERTVHIDRDFLPSKSRAIEICDLLLELTYPGGYGRRGLTRHNVRYHVGDLLPRLWEKVRDEILQCLCHELERDGKLPPDLSALDKQACELATRFVEQIPEIRNWLALDLQAHFDGDPAAGSTTEIILAYPGMLAITVHRYAHLLYTWDVPKLPRIMSEYAHRQTGIDIHAGAKIGHSFFIDHGTGVVIGETAQIGENVKMYQGVTLGALSFPRDEKSRVLRGHKRHPTIGNNVVLYANAIVLGGQTVIGDGAIIGGSTFITQSVLPGYQVSIAPPELKLRPPRTRKSSPADYVADWVI